MGASVQSISVADVSAREVDVRGVMRYCNVSFFFMVYAPLCELLTNLFFVLDIPYCHRNVGFWQS